MAVNVKAVITAEDKASGALKGFGRTAEAVNDKLITGAKRAAFAFGAAAAAATGFAVKSAADFEQTRIGLENMLGSADKARVLLKNISKFAAETPFEFPELAQATRQLVAFGFSAEDAFKTMQQLGDVSAAVGTPINDLAYLMGTLRTQGRAFTIDIRQFAQRGVPIYEYLAKVLKTNEKNLSALIEEGKIGFPEVQKAFQLMTGEGGKFNNTMQKQSKSLTGLFSTLKDTIGQAGRELVGITQEGDIKAGSLFDKLRIGIDSLNRNLPSLIEKFKGLISGVLPQLKQWAGNFMDVAKAVGDYLGPKLEALWNTVTTKLLPALDKFYREVVLPLLPVLGTVLVGAIGLVVDALNVFFSVITPIIGWVADNKYIVLGLAGAFGAVALAMKFGAIVAAFQKSMGAAVLTTKTSLASINTALKGFGGWAVFASVALGAFAQIMAELNKLHKELDTAQQAVVNTGNYIGDFYRSLKKARDEGRITEAEYQRRSKAYANSIQAPARAIGGPVSGGAPYTVGERGPELFVPEGAGTIVPNSAMQSPINITIKAGAFMGSQMEARKFALEIMRAYNDAQGMKGMAV